MLEEIQDYINARIALLRMEIMEKTAMAATILVLIGVIIFLFTVFIVFTSAALAYLLSDALDSSAAGFGIVSGAYFVLFLFVVIFRKALIEKPVLNFAIKYLFKKDEEERQDF